MWPGKRQSFGRVMLDLFQGFLSIDSRLAKSIPAILFRPGFLTRQYLGGKRIRYLHPVNMFITLVVIYFLLSSAGSNLKINLSNEKRNSPVNISVNKNNQVAGNTVSVFTDDKRVELTDTTVNNTGTGNNIEIHGVNYKEIKRLISSGTTGTDAILDSLDVEKTLWNRFWYEEIIKFAQSDFDDFRSYLVTKLPWFVFMLMPVFALLLKLLYIRHRILYFDHLIFAFHLHSFIFLAGIIYTLLLKLTLWDPLVIVNFVVLAYVVLAIKNIYRQSWFKTIVKILLLAILYLIAAFISMWLAILMAFLIY